MALRTLLSRTAGRTARTTPRTMVASFSSPAYDVVEDDVAPSPSSFDLFNPTEEHQQLRDMVRQFAIEKVRGRGRDALRNGRRHGNSPTATPVRGAARAC